MSCNIRNFPGTTTIIGDSISQCFWHTGVTGDVLILPQEEAVSHFQDAGETEVESKAALAVSCCGVYPGNPKAMGDGSERREDNLLVWTVNAGPSEDDYRPEKSGWSLEDSSSESQLRNPSWWTGITPL